MDNWWNVWFRFVLPSWLFAADLCWLPQHVYKWRADRKGNVRLKSKSFLHHDSEHSISELRHLGIHSRDHRGQVDCRARSHGHKQRESPIVNYVSLSTRCTSGQHLILRASFQNESTPHSLRRSRVVCRFIRSGPACAMGIARHRVLVAILGNRGLRQSNTWQTQCHAGRRRQPDGVGNGKGRR